MINSEKAKELAFEENGTFLPRSVAIEKQCLKMADWKDEQFKEYLGKKNEEEGKALLYAVDKTCERVKKEMIDKACEWFTKYLFEIGYPDDWMRDSPNMMSGEEKFRKAME